MINTKLTKAIIEETECPIKYCGAKKGEYCKTPNGNTCEDLHKKRYGKFVRTLNDKTTPKLIELLR